MSKIYPGSSIAPNLYVPSTVSAKSSASASASSSPATATSSEDSVQLSPAALRQIAQTGRIALDQQAGVLTSDQANQLTSQLASIQSTISTDLQNDGGTLSSSDAQTINQLQTQLSGQIYSDAHNGAAPPANPQTDLADGREALLAGRIALNEYAGNLSSDQASQFLSQVGTISQTIKTDTQNDGGTLSQADAQSINQLQTQLSQQIAGSAHAVSPDPITTSAS